MDFSKIKKIFYIIAIISMLLSIKSKVFGAAYDFTYEDTNYNLNIPDWIAENDLNYSFFIYNNSSTHNFTLLVYSADSVNINDVTWDNSFITFSSDNICMFNFGQGGNTFTDFMNEVNNYINTDVTFENYNNRKSSNTTTYLKTFYYDSFLKETTAPIYKNNEVILDTTITNFSPPYFDNSTEIQNGYPDGVFISRGDYSENDALFFHLLKITNTVPDGNQSTYYYDSKVFKLTKDSKYYKTYDADTENKYSYYYIERSALTLDTNSSYLYVLSNSGDSISNSYGILQPDIPSGIYDVVESDTAGVITEQQALNDKIANINNNQQDIANSQQEIANNSNNINNYLNENTISNDTNENINTNLNFNNQNSDLNNLNNGFFTRLTTMLSNISNYDLKEDTVVRIPFPNSQKYLELHSNVFYNNITGALRTIINAFWTFIFTFYLWKFINKIYIAVSSGSILDNFSNNGEAITNDML